LKRKVTIPVLFSFFQIFDLYVKFNGKIIQYINKAAHPSEQDEETQRLTGNLEALAHGFERGCLGKRLDLQFEDLTYKLPDGKVILSGVTGYLYIYFFNYKKSFF